MTKSIQSHALHANTQKAGHQGDIFLECVRINSRHRIKNVATHYIVAILPLMLGSTNGTLRSNLLLVAILLLYSTITIAYTYIYNKKPRTDRTTRLLGYSLYAQMVFVPCLYNLIFYNLYLHGVDNAMTYGLIVLTLYSAGVISSYHTMKYLGTIFLLSAMIPQLVYHFSLGTKEGYLFTFMIGIFVVFILQVSKEIYLQTIKTMMLNRELTAAREKAEHLAMTDELSGLGNRRSFFEQGNQILAAARRYHREASIIMIDIDHFKNINDSHGHAAGDRVIQLVAGILQECVRDSDVIGRIGGEEFAILLPETKSGESCELAERIRSKVGHITFDNNDITSRFTVSVGVADTGNKPHTLEELLSKADHALYEAKSAGRNQVVEYYSYLTARQDGN